MLAERHKAYHRACAEYIRRAPTQPMSSFDKSQTRKKTKRKTRAMAKKKMTMMTMTATRSERALVTSVGEQ